MSWPQTSSMTIRPGIGPAELGRVDGRGRGAGEEEDDDEERVKRPGEAVEDEPVSQGGDGAGGRPGATGKRPTPKNVARTRARSSCRQPPREIIIAKTM